MGERLSKVCFKFLKILLYNVNEYIIEILLKFCMLIKYVDIFYLEIVVFEFNYSVFGLGLDILEE